MKVKFKCVKCGVMNEFVVTPMNEEVYIVEEEVYIIECKKCGAPNQIELSKKEGE